MKKKFNQIMVLDDDEPTTYLVKLELEEQQCCNSIISFYNPVKALEYLGNTIQNGDTLPDVIFTDLNLPRINGWKFLEMLSQKLEQVSTPLPIIYVVSTSFNPDDKKKASETALVAGFLEKPLDEKKIQEVIKYAEAMVVET